MDQFRSRCKARAAFQVLSSEILQALLKVGTGPNDLGGHPGGGVVDGDAAGEGMHEGFGEPGKVDGLQGPEERREVEWSPAWHLQQFLFASLFPGGTRSVLLSVEKGDLASESGKEAALQLSILRKVMRSEGEGEVWMSGELGEPLDVVWCGEDLATMVFYCNGDAVLGGSIGMGFHSLGEFADLRL